MFRKVLIANRGEIALRIVRACRELGVRSVLAYSQADRNSLPVQLADEAVCIGPPASDRSYRNVPAVIQAALLTGCEALHPGYGFLAENADFAEIVARCGLVFIGPRPDTIEKMGDKSVARETMRRAGLPILPGSDRPIAGEAEAIQAARHVGYPVMLKAVAGGGGRGKRIAHDERELVRALPIARSEAQGAFGSSEMYLEKYLEQPRHIEVQVLGDAAGQTVLSLGERECSLQRRLQKVIEEAPAIGISDRLRRDLAAAAVKGARAVRYANAGTVEFLVDRAGRYYFLEINTRIQVEHGLTEVVTGVDLVKWQLRVAAGQPLTLRQRDLQVTGHAVEVRILAENPARDFEPAAGRVRALHLPGGPGIRVDSHLYPGCDVPPHYDSLLAKIIAWGGDRDEAITRTARALDELVVDGVATTASFQRALLDDPRYRRGELHTRFVEQYLSEQAVGAAAGGPG
ncbi:MAG: acetyl-CoA carboxylase biotin carboxylase subunit [Chloroflexi bacterium]|nr:acetyl-CoA carboxylase biotin carboxylase subunit [Chloroflexota bacterium]